MYRPNHCAARPIPVGVLASQEQPTDGDNGHAEDEKCPRPTRVQLHTGQRTLRSREKYVFGHEWRLSLCH